MKKNFDWEKKEQNQSSQRQNSLMNKKENENSSFKKIKQLIE